MAREPFRTTLYELNQVTPTVRELKIRIEDGKTMPFKSGQFVMLQVPVEGKDKPVQRAYSIASSSERDDEFVLIFKHVPGGIASEYVKKLEGGETLQFTGPWGKCLFKTPPAEQVLFVCTGTGLSQHYCFLMSEAAKYPGTRFHMLIGVRDESEVYYVKELEAAKKKFPNFNYDWCLSRPGDTWKGKRGRVTAFLPEFNISGSTTHVYLCGSDALVKDVKKMLVEDNGFPKENLIIENFG